MKFELERGYEVVLIDDGNDAKIMGLLPPNKEWWIWYRATEIGWDALHEESALEKQLNTFMHNLGEQNGTPQ